MTDDRQDDEPVRVDRCGYPGCSTLTRNLYCDRHRERARLHDPERDEDGDDPPAAA